MNIIKDNIVNIVTVWVPAFLLFGQSIGVFLKTVGLKSDLKGVKDMFSSLDKETVKSLGLLEKVPKLVESVTTEFMSKFESVGKEFTEYMEKLLTLIQKDIKGIEDRIEERVNEIESRQHNQIVKLRRQANGQDGEEDVSEI